MTTRATTPTAQLHFVLPHSADRDSIKGIRLGPMGDRLELRCVCEVIGILIVHVKGLWPSTVLEAGAGKYIARRWFLHEHIPRTFHFSTFKISG